MDWLDILEVLTPLTVLTILLSGFVIGFVYSSQVDFSKAFGYHSIVITTAFFVCLIAIRYVEGIESWYRWVGALVLYVFYIFTASIGKYMRNNFKRVVK